MSGKRRLILMESIFTLYQTEPKCLFCPTFFLETFIIISMPKLLSCFLKWSPFTNKLIKNLQSQSTILKYPLQYLSIKIVCIRCIINLLWYCFTFNPKMSHFSYQNDILFKSKGIIFKQRINFYLKVITSI